MARGLRHDLRAFARVFAGSGPSANWRPPGGILLYKEVTGKEIHIRKMLGDSSFIRVAHRGPVSAGSGRLDRPRLYHTREK